MPPKKLNYDAYLKSLYSAKGQEHTHTRIGDNSLSIKGGVYSIEDLDAFNKHYIKHVFEDGKFEFLTEKQLPSAGPLCLDFDFRYNTDIEERQHDESDIQNIIELYMNEIKCLLNISSNTKIPIFVFEKDDVNLLENITKDGIHMIIGIHMEQSMQTFLRDKILGKIGKVWEKLPLVNSWDEVIDEGIVRGTTNWQLYGSRKPGHQPYLLKYHYDIEFDEDDEVILYENEVKEFDIKKRFFELSVRYPNHQSFEINDNIADEYNEYKTSNVSSKQKKNKLKIIEKNRNYNLNDITSLEILDEALEKFLEEVELQDYEVKETHEYTMCLTANYYNPYDKWIRVGWALKNTHNKLFLTWMRFSAQSEKFSFDKIPEFYDMWCNFDICNEDGLTKRSIIYWAKNDNPSEFIKIREETIDYHVEKTIENQTDFDIANVLYQMFKDRYTCVSIKRDLWYVYNNHKWEENESGTSLRMEISRGLFDIYYKKQKEILNYMASGTLDPASDKYQAISKRGTKISVITNDLKRRGCKDNIMREAKEIFYDKDFIDKIDANPKLLCFNNGVLDFEIKKFRKGQPDDYISKSTKIDYIPYDETKHKNTINELNDFMQKLFPEKELRDYMWEHFASTLIGENNDQTFNIYNGSGSNGKSKAVELMSLCLGDYKATVPITLITQKRNSIGSTSSEVVQLKGARYAVMQEPSKGDRINEGIMKEITGGDPLQGRALFKDSITFIPQFKLVVCTNTLLDVPSNDEGTWRRICVCEFISKFCEPKDFDSMRKHQFPLDKKLGDKFKIWAPIFMSMLVKKAFETNGLVQICDIVKKSSGNYRNTQDYYSEFVADKIKVCEGSKIKETSLYETFKIWYQLHHGKNIPKGRDLFDYMNKKFGKKQRGGWHNLSIIYDDFDVELEEEE